VVTYKKNERLLKERQLYCQILGKGEEGGRHIETQSRICLPVKWLREKALGRGATAFEILEPIYNR
jgi:hypothetical protein